MKIGAQMYTLREFCKTEKEFDDSCQKVAAIGYKYVQLSGGAYADGTYPASVVRGILDKHGLKAVLTHTPQKKMMEDIDNVIKFHKEIGADYVGIGSLPGDYSRTMEGISQFCADFSKVAEKLHKNGLTFMYHNHSFEFARVEGKLIMDIIAEKIPNAGFTLDTYWVQHGGGDPACWLNKLKGRIDCIHFKDMMIYNGEEGFHGEQRMEVVGKGNLNWDAIFAACNGVKYAFVEQDDCYGENPFECLAESYKFLKSKGVEA